MWRTRASAARARHCSCCLSSFSNSRSGRRSRPDRRDRIGRHTLRQANGPVTTSLRLHGTVPAVEGGPTTSGRLWVHEIKHDGYRLMVRRDGARVRCFTRNGHDWVDRFPAIVDAALRIKATSFLMDGGGDRARRRDVGLPRAAEGCSRKTDAASHCTRVNLFREH